MPKRADRSDGSRSTPATIRVPAGAPSWVTPELLEHTIRVWQPYYQVQLIPADALEIIMSVGQLVDVLSSGDSHETVRRFGSGQQP
jgi:hypothetical protein